MPHIWTHSRSGWTGLWATCLLQRGWTKWCIMCLLTQTVLWFYEYCLYCSPSEGFLQHYHSPTSSPTNLRMLQSNLLVFENGFKPGLRQVEDKPRYTPPGQGTADRLLQIANRIITYNVKLSWRKLIIIIWIWKEWMEPAGHLKDDSVIPNVYSALAEVLCREHGTKSVSTTP